MKKKLFILATICAMGLGAQQLNAANPFIAHTPDKTVDGKEKIDFQGTIPLTSNAMKATANSNTVCLTFSQNIGYVSVTLIDGNGNLVYNGIVDTSAQRVVVIPTGNSEGRCTLVVENAAGYAEGDFERKK